MMLNTLSFPRILTGVLLGWFIFLSALHLFVDRPLWNDEAAVFESIEAYSTEDMFTQDLKRHQVFPRVYLFFIQQASKMFDYSRWSLRLPAFLCMLTAFYLWSNKARTLFFDRNGYYAFLLSWSASMMMVYYAAELKPYAMDVLTAVIGLYLMKRSSPYVWLYPLTGLVSYPAFLFSFILLYNLWIKSIREGLPYQRVLVYAGILFAVILGAYQFDMQYRNETSVNTGYHDYFIATHSFSAFFKTFGEGVKDLFINWFATQPKWIRHIASFYGVFGFMYMFAAFPKNLKKDGYKIQSIETAAFVLFGMLFILGILQNYPFIVPRTVLFYAPFVFYLIIKGIESVRVKNLYMGRVLLTTYIFFLTGLTVFYPSLILTKERLFQPLF